MKKLVGEIHRRSRGQVLGIYLVGGWAVLKAVNTLSGALWLPDWTSSMGYVHEAMGRTPAAVAQLGSGPGSRRTLQ